MPYKDIQDKSDQQPGHGGSHSSHLTVPTSSSFGLSSLLQLRHVGEPECSLSPKNRDYGTRTSWAKETIV